MGKDLAISTAEFLSRIGRTNSPAEAIRYFHG